MFIDVSAINNGKTDVWIDRAEKYRFNIDDYEAVVSVNGSVSNENGLYTFNGFIEGEIHTYCSKCLKDVVLPYKQELIQLFRRKDQDDTSLSETDDEILIINGYLADFTPVITGIIKADMPIAIACSESCKGLCPKCGCDLNVSACGCKTEYVNPAFEGLKELKF